MNEVIMTTQATPSPMKLRLERQERWRLPLTAVIAAVSLWPDLLGGLAAAMVGLALFWLASDSAIAQFCLTKLNDRPAARAQHAAVTAVTFLLSAWGIYAMMRFLLPGF